MPKGKKFNAAEKHFLKKEETLRREIKDLQDTGVVRCYDVIRQKEIDGNSQTVYYLYQLVQSQTSFAPLNLTNVGSGYSDLFR